jgi:hypothetical protein
MWPVRLAMALLANPFTRPKPPFVAAGGKAAMETRMALACGLARGRGVDELGAEGQGDVGCRVAAAVVGYDQV